MVPTEEWHPDAATRRLEETRLVAAMLRGDEAAWQQFLDGHVSVMAHAARQVLGEGESEEIVAEVCRRLLERDRRLLRTFRGGSALATWIWALARGLALERLRRLRRESRHRTPLPTQDLPSPEVPDASAFAQRLRQAIALLPERDQKVLRMAFWERRPYAEIALELGLSPETVGPLLSRAKAQLVKIIKTLPG